MSHDVFPSSSDVAAATADLRERHRQLLASSNGRMRARDAARALGVTEGALLAAWVGDTVTPLRGDCEAILLQVGTLGRVMALTRNAFCVHERKGVYRNLSFGNGIGLAVGEEIDLRLFMKHWRHAFAVVEARGDGVARSLQFFDARGDAVHKVHLLEESDVAAFDRIVETFSAADIVPAFGELGADGVGGRGLPAGFDAEAFRAGWDALRDTHDFNPLLKRHGVHRLDAFEVARGERAARIELRAYREALAAARDQALSIMVFVGNAGCIQIHTGPVHNLKEMGDWYNVLDPAFNLHLLETGIAEAWRVRKPTRDGVVTSLELFDADGRPLMMLFGARKPGKPENGVWREIAESSVDGVAA